MKVLLLVILSLLALFVAVCIPHNLRARRARRAARRLSPEARRRALELLAEAGSRAPAATLLLPSDDVVPSLVRGRGLSRVGGRPLGREEVLPRKKAADSRAKDAFLLQVELDHPELSPVWQGRLITVHLVDWKPIVHSFAGHEVAGLRLLELPQAPLPERTLLHVPVPVTAGVMARETTAMNGEKADADEHDDGDDDEDVPPFYEPSALLAATPGLEQALDGQGTSASDLLAQVLQRNGFGYALETPDIAYVGGRPEFIQSEQALTCPTCRQPMRFLFQFGELFLPFRLADGGVGYVYGCDAHPERCGAWIDGH